MRINQFLNLKYIYYEETPPPPPLEHPHAHEC